MATLKFFATAAAILQGAAAAISLTVQPFLLVAQSTVSNAKLSWIPDSNAAFYQIQSRVGSNEFTNVTVVPGLNYDDYGLPAGNVTYQIIPLDHANHTIGSLSNALDLSIGQSNPTPFTTYSNLQLSTLVTKSQILYHGIYYQYIYESNSFGFSTIAEQTSSDGYNFTGNRSVLTEGEVCEGSDTVGCIMERISFIQHPQTDEVFMWAHWENNQSYSLARVAVAFGLPGGQFTFGGSFRPLGNDSRDLTFFIDKDESGYLVSATRVNTDMAIYALTSDWHNITSKVATVLQNQHREAPAMVNIDGYYYLFTSTAAGWYPSAGQFISATALAGPWSSSQNIGDLAKFAAQSGEIVQIGTQWAMMADRWGANWKYPETSNRQLMLPLSFENGQAAYHFYPTVQYTEAGVAGNLLGVQNGKIVSTGRPVTAGAAVSPYNSTLGNDGITLSTTNYYEPAQLPFTYEINLASKMAVSHLDLSTKLVGGSETYYNYTIDCINNGATSVILVDMTKNTVVGFTTAQIMATTLCEAVRLNANKVVNVQNGNEADWAAGVVELTVYGS